MSPLHLLLAAFLFAGLSSAQDNTTMAPTEAPTDAPTDPPVPPMGPYTVTYQINYTDADCFMQTNMSIMEGNSTRFFFDYNVPAFYKTEIMLQDDITLGQYYSVIDVMELAVDEESDIYFSVIYKGSDMGYFVKGIGPVRSNMDCMWFFYYQGPNMDYAFLKTRGVSEFVAEPNSTIVMRYQYPPIHAVYYEIEFPHPTNCTLDEVPRPDPLTIDLYFGAPNYTYSVQKVMELAVDIDPSYEFIVTYYGKNRGYEVDAINGTENHDECTWHFFYIPPRTARENARNYSNITYFKVEANSTILMSFQIIPKPPPVTTPPPTDPTTEPPSPSSSSAVTDPPSSSEPPTPTESTSETTPSETPTSEPTDPPPDPEPSPTPSIPTPPKQSPTGSANVPLVDLAVLLLLLIACAVF